jgi:hypothetical protein
MALRAVALDHWQRLARRKPAERDDQIAKARTAREAINHAQRCPHEDILACPNFRGFTSARLAGQPLHEAHAHELLRKASRPGPPGGTLWRDCRRPDPSRHASPYRGDSSIF